jgi:hypothetical protein
MSLQGLQIAASCHPCPKPKKIQQYEGVLAYCFKVDKSIKQDYFGCTLEVWPTDPFVREQNRRSSLILKNIGKWPSCP